MSRAEWQVMSYAQRIAFIHFSPQRELWGPEHSTSKGRDIRTHCECVTPEGVPCGISGIATHGLPRGLDI